jgi:hypothetical protein
VRNREYRIILGKAVHYSQKPMQSFIMAPIFSMSATFLHHSGPGSPQTQVGCPYIFINAGLSPQNSLESINPWKYSIGSLVWTSTPQGRITLRRYSIISVFFSDDLSWDAFLEGTGYIFVSRHGTGEAPFTKASILGLTPPFFRTER